MKMISLLCIFFLVMGCATHEKITEAHELQNQAVDNLNTNYQELINQTLTGYKAQTDDDFSFIRDLLIKQNPAESSNAEQVYRDKITERDAELEKVRSRAKRIEGDYKIYKGLQEVLIGN